MESMGNGGRRGRVLLVVGPGQERDALRRALEEQQFDVNAVAGDDEVLPQAARWSPSTVLVDLDRPGSDGLDVCRQLKGDARTSFLPVLLLTSRQDDDRLVAAGIEAGATDFLFKPWTASVLLARVATQLSLYEAQVKLRQLVITDDLTGVFSRRFLFESMRHMAKQISRGGPPVLACLMVDIDHFKALNDDVGILQADRVLKTVAQIIRRSTRDSDVVSRFGGEEFAVILPSTGGGGARITAEKIRGAVERETQVTVSIGVSWCELPTEVEAQSLLKPEDVILNVIKKADAALVRAKSQGRNRVVSQSDLEGRESSIGVPILLEVVDESGRQAYYSTELALTGVAIQHEPGSHVGDDLNLRLHLDDRIVPLKGQVVWTGPVTGVGMQSCIAFTGVPPETYELLDAFVRGKAYESEGQSGA